MDVIDPPISLPAYKSYRLYMTRNSGGNQGYFAISEWRMYEHDGADAPNILTGGTPSASHTNSSYPVRNAFDGNESTTWEAPSSPSTPKWVRYDLPEPVVVRAIYLSHNTWASERPRDFEIQGSNDDGETWDVIASFEHFLTTSVASRRSSLVRNLAGNSIMDGGAPMAQIRIYDWDSGQLLATVTPDEAGDWSLLLPAGDRVMVVHVPTEGYRPMADGPITVWPRW